MDFAVSAERRVKPRESEKGDNYIDRENYRYENEGYTTCIRCTRYSHQKIGKWTGGLGNNKNSGDYPNCSIVEIGKNSQKSSGDLREPLPKAGWKTLRRRRRRRRRREEEEEDFPWWNEKYQDGIIKRKNYVWAAGQHI